ncbi:TonB-dependent receptor domain-containing protein [Novosphingobium beihaiensis]|uniref:TonB-dependent receptor n=1 Tax=Novosphingobium beihaiensis TaxID=2930389 RepID=A0ABT0BL61_9SPHN|nr:TonB-dependent receptor [Novosphingobium beihaiensis]MCJ2185801.1 TonB-dependent receptor [Novosphingobium beihaiensis]
MRRFLIGASAVAVAASGLVALPAVAQDAGGDPQGYAGITAPGENTPEEAEAVADKQDEKPAKIKSRKRKAAPLTDSDILVTGSRLKGGDETSRTQVITRQDIEKRGVTSVTELLRTLPENLATIGAITNNRLNGPLRNPGSRGKGAVSELGVLGVSAANLGGSGAGNTLILINGRRMAGAAGIEDGFVNLNDIPLAAVDRVEIDTSGSSAVYGSDAIGGVINFILKKNYVGTTLTGGYKKSNNGADVLRLSAYSGYAWGTGSLSGSVSYRKSKPVENAKTGFVTQNYSDYYNGDVTYDRRNFSNGAQPGLIDQTEYDFDPDTFETIVIPKALTVRPGVVGVPTADDFVTVGPDARRDFVPKFGGPETNSLSVTANFEQKITDKLKFVASGLYTRNKNYQDTPPQSGLSLQLAPGQYYNPFPAYQFDPYMYSPATPVYYFPEFEIASGDVEYGTISNRSEAWSVNASLEYDFNENTTLELLYSRSGTSSKARSDNFSSLVSIRESADNPGTYECSNFRIDNPQYYQGDDYDNFVSVFNRQCEALTSSNPDVAFNPWKSTGDGGGVSAAAFLWQDNREIRSSDRENYEARLRGNLFNLPGGAIRYAVGGEWNTDGIGSKEVRDLNPGTNSTNRYAFFGELSLPLIGNDFTLPFIHKLTFNVSARRDVYKTEGAVATVDDIPVDDGGVLIYRKNTFGRTTPSFGLRWEPTSTLILRGRISHGFKAPPFTRLFDVNGGRISPFQIANDPYYDCREQNDCDFDYGDTYYGYYAERIFAPNPDLKPQTSVQKMLNALWQPQGALRGLRLEVTYNHTRIKNTYASSNDLARYLSNEEQYARSDFYPRDENGKIIASNLKTFNIGASTYSSITYSASYIVNTKFGSFEPTITYLNNLKSESKPFDNGRVYSTLGRLQGIDRYNITGQLSWYYNDLTVTLLGYYTPSYINDYEVITAAGVNITPENLKPVGSYTTFDLSASWRASNSLKFSFAGRNIFDAKPPFVVVGDVPYDTARYDVKGRTLYLEAQFSF